MKTKYRKDDCNVEDSMYLNINKGGRWERICQVYIRKMDLMQRHEVQGKTASGAIKHKGGYKK